MASHQEIQWLVSGWTLVSKWLNYEILLELSEKKHFFLQRLILWADICSKLLISPFARVYLPTYLYTHTHIYIYLKYYLSSLGNIFSINLIPRSPIMPWTFQAPCNCSCCFLYHLSFIILYLTKFLESSLSYPAFPCFLPRTLPGTTYLQSKCIYRMKTLWSILALNGQNFIWK